MNADLLWDFIKIFIPLFVVLDPMGTVPVFLALTGQYTDAQRKIMARRATIVAMIVGVLFVIVGQSLFRFLGVAFADFQIAGGLLLVILAILDLLSTGKPAVDEHALDQPSPGTTSSAKLLSSGVEIVPLAVPLIVGPATLTTSLLLVNTYSAKYEDVWGTPWGQMAVAGTVCLALLLNLLIMYGAMYHSGKIARALGQGTMLVVNKIVMILMAAIAVSLIRQGIISIVSSHR